MTAIAPLDTETSLPPSTLTWRKGLPTFLILGAPKCGTTALHYYLSQHPDIYLGKVKEPHYFARDLIAPMYVQDQSRYEALFEGFDGQAHVGEASPLYLYSTQAAKEIAAFNPDIKVIAMFRDPVEAAYSLHSGLRANGREIIDDFSAALDAEDLRRRGVLPIEKAVPPSVIFYRAVMSFGEQLERLYAHIPREQVHVIFYDDFQADAQAATRAVHAFLGVEPLAPQDTSVRNKNKVSRLPGLWRTWMNMPPHWRARISTLIPKGVRSKMLMANRKEIDRSPLLPKVERELAAEMAADIAKLQALTGRDLSHWMNR